MIGGAAAAIAIGVILATRGGSKGGGTPVTITQALLASELLK